MNRHLKFEIGDTAFVINKENITVDEVEVEEYDFKTAKYESRVYKEGREYLLKEDEMFKTRREAEKESKRIKEKLVENINKVIG